MDYKEASKLRNVDCLIEAVTEYTEQDDGSAVAKHTQEIPDWYLDQIAEKKSLPFKARPDGYFHAFSIPEPVYIELLAKGFNPYTMKAWELERYMKQHSLEKFLTTDHKTIFSPKSKEI